jgi:hypothetical protein
MFIFTNDVGNEDKLEGIVAPFNCTFSKFKAMRFFKSKNSEGNLFKVSSVDPRYIDPKFGELVDRQVGRLPFSFVLKLRSIKLRFGSLQSAFPIIGPCKLV